MKRNTKTVLFVSGVLIAAAIALALLNRDNVLQKKAMQEAGTFLIAANGQEWVVSMEDLRPLSRTVQTNAKTKNTDYEKKQFTGVSLAVLLERLGVEYSTAETVIFSAADGYASAIPAAEAFDTENCFIVFEENGKPLGTPASGGTGPHMMIMAKDPFGQRWCKYLLEISLN
ncbi:MAG: molybdopterin-dependent oxidoreductase [Clostridiales bacterium]|nr:molybdopterin-dependent oxidoreductase [Clostridiales bacterium]